MSSLTDLEGQKDGWIAEFSVAIMANHDKVKTMTCIYWHNHTNVTISHLDKNLSLKYLIYSIYRIYIKLPVVISLSPQ